MYICVYVQLYIERERVCVCVYPRSMPNLRGDIKWTLKIPAHSDRRRHGKRLRKHRLLYSCLKEGQQAMRQRKVRQLHP